MEVKDWSATDASNTLLGSINLAEGVTTVDQGNDIARALMGAVARQLGDVNAASSNIASAATTNLATATGWFVTITGTTTITSFGTVTAGQLYILRFSGSMTLTHNATSLILPGAANIAAVSDDVAMMMSLGSGNWRCVGYQRASGVPVGNVATTTDNAIARYNGTTGKLQNSNITISDTGDLSLTSGSVLGSIDYYGTGLITTGGDISGTNITATGTLTTTGNATIGGNLNMTAGNITNVSELFVSEINITSPIGATFGGSVASNSYLQLAATTFTPPAGGNNLKGVILGGAAMGVFWGSGAPTLSADKGSLYLRSDGTTTNNRMYVNTNGSTTWTAVTTVA